MWTVTVFLLGDDEEHACVQCISRYGIYCNYFKNAVIPAETNLLAKIMQPTSKKRCQICKAYFVPKANNQRYCPDRAAAIQKRKKAAECQRRKRAAHSQSDFRTESWWVLLFCPNVDRNSLLTKIVQKIQSVSEKQEKQVFLSRFWWL